MFFLAITVIALLGLLYLADVAKERLERRRLRKVCPTCQEGLAVVMVSHPELLCPDHKRRLHQIEQLERDELS